jgi:hypothetical protein
LTLTAKSGLKNDFVFRNHQSRAARTRNYKIYFTIYSSYLLNPSFIKAEEGYIITTQLTFQKKWGLGTSSTLINNIAQWLQIDAFTLLNNSFGGSGYDIAPKQQPILYHLEKGKAMVEKATFQTSHSIFISFI